MSEKICFRPGICYCSALKTYFKEAQFFWKKVNSIFPHCIHIFYQNCCLFMALQSVKERCFHQRSPSTLSLILKNKDTDQISLFFAEAQQSCLLPCSLRAGCTKLDCTLQKPHIGKLWRKIPSRLRTHLGSYRSSERREKYRSPWCEMHVIHLLHNRQPKRL